MVPPLHPVDAALLLPGHLGALHPVEQGLTLLLAFGPFAVLGVVVAVRRRRDAAEERQQDPARPSRPERPTPPERPA